MNQAESQQAPSLELPDLQAAVLDEEQVRRLLADIESGAEVLDVSLKRGPRDKPVAGVELRELADQLTSGRVFGAQIRYQFRNNTWLDTLLRVKQGVRLIRIQH